MAFARRYFPHLDRYCAERMEELGVPSGQIGSSDHRHGIAWCAFNPHETAGGGVTPEGRITVDAGIFDDTLFPHSLTLRDRIDAVLAHEYEEHARGSHEAAMEHAPDTALPITHAAREHLRRLRDSRRGR